MSIDKNSVKKLIGMISLFSVFLLASFFAEKVVGENQVTTDRLIKSKARVCPPFFLKDEKGNIINPVSGENAANPYSPKQTCGSCHDYDKITQGYHFQQGADENAKGKLKERVQWASTPGNYGGAWCSPAPLYPYLSQKHNNDPHLLDMTSFTFITKGCGQCHPGGGPLEYDRDGKRYDEWMSDPASGFSSGGDNNLDGDYFKARWSESGVIEADCLICHLPSYNFDKRNQQISKLNFKWAATSAAGLAKVEGSVADNIPITVTYDVSKFDSQGHVLLKMVVSPRNETCLTCHAQPGWKKRGADFRARTDVHIRAGMRCVDCHPAGSRADDPRIKGREVHQIGKGDDPGELVRDDLDNTMRDCSSCHTSGEFGAPVARHSFLPPLHLKRIACQTCHIPEKLVMPIQVQASDVFNTDTLIPIGGKQLWTFYGVDGTYRNHYGILNMMGYDNKPTEKFRPVLVRYKGKIYPANRIHSSWPAIEFMGKPGLMEPRPSDIYKMWKEHNGDPANHPELAKITDDNDDGVIEVNRPDEIDALITSVTKYLTGIGYPMEGKRVVWVMNNRIYSSGSEYREIPIESWEASAYGNVHKYNHDVQPAASALGAGGCTDCHDSESPFFMKGVLVQQFDTQTAIPLWTPNHKILGISSLSVKLGEFREEFLKPSGIWIIAAWVLFILLHYVIVGRRDMTLYSDEDTVVRFSLRERIAHFMVFAPFLVLTVTGLIFFMSHSSLNGGVMRTLHKWTGFVFGAGVFGLSLVWLGSMLFVKSDLNWLKDWFGMWLQERGGALEGRAHLSAGKFNPLQKMFFWVTALCGFILLVTGGIIAYYEATPEVNLAVLFTIHDFVALCMLLAIIAHFYVAVFLNTQSLRSFFGGRVSRKWLNKYH